MATFVHDNARILVNAQDISGDSNHYEIVPSVEIKDVSTFGTSWIKRLGGSGSHKLTASGFLNNTPATLFTDLVTDDPWTTVTSVAAGFTAEMVGSTLTITGGHANINAGDYTIKSFTAADTIVMASAIGDTGAVATGAGYVRGEKNLQAIVGTDENEITIIPEGFTAGNEALFGQMTIGEYSLSGAFGDVAPWNLTAEGDNEFVGGILLEEATKHARVNTTSAAQVIAGGVPTGYVLWGMLHVLNLTGNTPTLDVIIQSDDGIGGTWVPRITFTQAVARTQQMASDATVDTVDTNFRVSVTVGGADDVAIDAHYVCSVGIALV